MNLILLIVGGLMRLIGLNQSMWLDETVTANVAMRRDFWNIVSQFSVNDFHPPLYYFLINFWAKLVGKNVFYLRLSSVIFSLVTVLFLYLIAKELVNKKIAKTAGLFLLFNPLFVYYSQELRMYMMVTAFLTMAVYNLVKLIKKDKFKIKNLIGFNIFAGLSFLTFYGSIFLLGGISLYLLFKKKFKLLFLTNIGTILAIVGVLPLTLTQMHHAQIALTEVKNWSLVLGRANLKNLLLIPLKFSIGRVSFYPKIIYYLVSGFWTGIILWFGIKGIVKKKFLGFLLIIPIVLGFIFSFFSPMMDYFRFLYLLPILSLLLAIGVNKNWQKLLILVGFGVFSSIYLLNQNFYREDWQSLSKDLDNNQPVYMIESLSDPIKFYRPDIIIKDIQTRPITEKKVTVIPYAETIHGFNHEQKLEDLGYKKIDQTDYRGVILEKWGEPSLLNH